ncbi:hypothetical protein DIPPA_55566 [Diplonema papillatum]|nr:hypothetical protein DIPPA_55566 [Diplonema papillatum]
MTVRLYGDLSGRKSIRRRLLLFTVNVTTVTLYLCLGGLSMKALESPEEDSNRDALVELLSEVNLTDAQLGRLQSLGVCNFKMTKQWTLSGSVFYSMTVITTIGYGNLAPTTYNGRSFTVCYAIFGIGVIAQLLGSCAGILIGMASGTWARLCGKKVSTRLQQDEEDDLDPWVAWEDLWQRLVVDGQFDLAKLPELLEKLTGVPRVSFDSQVMDYVKAEADKGNTGFVSPATVARTIALWLRTTAGVPKKVKSSRILSIFTACVLWAVLWAFAFSAIEGWTYRESLWFCVVTMSTIGFGDFSPGSKLGRGLAFLFIIPGLGLSAACLGGIWDVFEVRRFWCLQTLMKRGVVSKKMLEAHDIQLYLRPEPTSVPVTLLGRVAFNTDTFPIHLASDMDSDSFQQLQATDSQPATPYHRVNPSTPGFNTFSSLNTTSFAQALQPVPSCGAQSTNKAQFVL